ncbi:MAG: hydroxysqualene dehydroxylase HpnE [Rhodocyclaceae bacterium]|nr:FAD-dependent oxidoreductase [Rhodocyclaceae bacterium]MBR4736110.1 hydroxysqualene dehydroxylase HpnE [Rhodocyclaceae bacterium]
MTPRTSSFVHADVCKLPVGIIGGGYAGMAAAVELTRHGVPAVVLERSTVLGGRARCVHTDGYALDNGQHLLLGAYTELLRLMRFLRVPPRVLERRALELRTASGELHFLAARAPAPWHLALGLWRAHGLDWNERLACLRLMRLLRRKRPLPEPLRSVTELLAYTRQPERLNRLLWHPLCISALNTRPEEACAHTFQHVLQDSLGAAAPASEFLVPRCDLSELFPVPAARFLGSHGARVHVSATVKAIRPLSEGGFMLEGTGFIETRVGHLIIAVAPYHVEPLLAPLLPKYPELVKRIQNIEYRPISTTWFHPGADWRTPHPILALTQGPAQWLFDRSAFGDPQGLWALVASASEPASAEAHTTAVWQQLRRELDRPLSPPKWARTVTERRATFACLPEFERPPIRTPMPGVFLAGDYLDPRYPATLEAAVRTGIVAARTILRGMSKRAS